MNILIPWCNAIYLGTQEPNMKVTIEAAGSFKMSILDLPHYTGQLHTRHWIFTVTAA